MSRLALGPIVGHTDTHTSCVWVQTTGPSDAATLRVEGRAPVPFRPTDPDADEFHTAIARLEGLEPDTLYTYEVVVAGDVCALGSMRTMPESADEISFVSLSCNDGKGIGAWNLLAEAIEREAPRFLLMLGDQVYLDMPDEDLWKRHLDSSPAVRRRAIAVKYREVWSRQPQASIMANIPTYMVWDDHDIRDGWGSSAADSPTLARRYPRGRPIHDKHRAFFEDARDVYYHFQACRNPSPASALDGAAPFSLRCGPLQVIVLDERSERDFMRPKNPVLGDTQWRFIHETVERLDDSVRAIVVANGIPIVGLAPDGLTNRMFRNRTDDIEPFRRGDYRLLEKRRTTLTPAPFAAFAAGLGTTIDRSFRLARLLHLSSADIDDARDRWDYASNRDEQLRLLHLFSKAAAGDGPGHTQRGLMFIGGDIHIGALFDLEFSDLGFMAQSLVTSGISQTPPPLAEVRGGVIDTDFEVTKGIHAQLAHLVHESNFALTRIRFEADHPPVISNGFGHKGADK
jgi:phosphodiesterase/alkaline phosphatase D-like protein